jgi:hypothetical protein
MSNFLTAFDVDDGRTPCPIRTQTVTAPQALFTMNNDFVERQSNRPRRSGPPGPPGDVGPLSLWHIAKCWAARLGIRTGLRPLSTSKTIQPT